MGTQLGKTIIIIGVVIVLIGLILTFKDTIPFLKNIGKLPGDIHMKKENFSFYFPLTTSIVISIILTLILYFINYFKK